MVYEILSNAVMVLHLLFILFVIAGALLLFKWPFIAWIHIPCVIWGVLIELNHWVCPLTPIENYLRQRAGQSGYDTGFIEYYISKIIYPPGLTSEIQILLAITVILTNLVIYSVAGYRYFSIRNNG